MRINHSVQASKRFPKNYKMKSAINTTGLILLFTSALLISSCKKDNPAPPVITTTEVTQISYTTAFSGGNLTSEGGATVDSTGICWNTSGNPTIENSTTSENVGMGAFTSILTQLTPNTKYYVRAYASNSTGTVYGNEINFTTLNYGTVTDIEGTIYNTVTIGTQVWMAENLKVEHYLNNDLISNISDNVEWSSMTTGAYCVYDNIGNSTTYGKLYNFYAVADARKICPAGWHVPTDAEWTILTTFLGGESVAGGKMKETGLTHWTSPNAAATNESGFSALPGGYRYYQGSWLAINSFGGWWTSTEYSTGYADYRGVGNTGGELRIDRYNEAYGFSIRCIQDN
jgi:uncharacterized protein (TIGR02145 family)